MLHLKSRALAGLMAAALLHPAAPASAAEADQFRIGAIVVTGPWTREPPGAAKVAGGFMRITNSGTAPDRLVGGSVGIARRFEVHEMTMTDSVMRMRELPDGLDIAPGTTIELKPGGFHVMFMDLTAPIKAGDRIKGRLKFEKAGEVEVEFQAVRPGASGAGVHQH